MKNLEPHEMIGVWVLIITFCSLFWLWVAKVILEVLT